MTLKPQSKKLRLQPFILKRDIYQLVKNYGKTIQSTIAELRQGVGRKESENQESLIVRQRFDKSSQIIQQEFRQVASAIWQELREDKKSKDSNNLMQKEVTNSIELIQKEIDKLRIVVHQELIKPEKNFDSFSQKFQNSLKTLMSKVQDKLDDFQQK